MISVKKEYKENKVLSGLKGGRVYIQERSGGFLTEVVAQLGLSEKGILDRGNI